MIRTLFADLSNIGNSILPLSRQFYLKAIQKNTHEKLMMLQKDGLGKDKRPFYNTFIAKHHLRVTKPEKMERFITDNLQLVRRGAILNSKCASFMQDTTDNKEKQILMK